MPSDFLTARLRQAFAFFQPGEELAKLEPLGQGRINGTWLAVTKAGAQYVLQRLNPAVFPDPALVQANLCRVTDHLRARLAAESGFRVFHVLRGPAGQTAWIDSSGTWWRLLSYLDRTQTVESVSRPEQAWEIGAALGLFHCLLADLPPLTDPLPGFHDTPLYLAHYDAILPTVCQPEAADCRDFINERRADAPLLEDGRRRGTVSVQNVHGDPKVGNFLLSADGNQAVSLVDLDTVRPGLLLHDLGDCLRSCCNPLGEEMRHLDEIVFDRELFAAVLAGYCSRAADLLKPGDRQLIVASTRLISLELGLRFYSDHLAGNPYFKADWPEQNLFRARVQFALVRSIERQAAELEGRAAMTFPAEGGIPEQTAAHSLYRLLSPMSK